uniref:Lipocalin/cytosolic fatty-acid binding domain-containing protein n=1 Tax=Amblyomma maculatum TaxID=34609 RepID=G3MQW6_AMBMU
MNRLPEALRSARRIWVTFSSDEGDTEGGRYRCYYRLWSFSEGTTFEFDQYFKNRTVWHKDHLYGNVETDAEGNSVIKVEREQGTPWRQYAIKFWDAHNKCGVLSYSENGAESCELIVWENQLPQSGYTYSCEPNYDEICKGFRKYSLYEGDCLPQRDEFLREEINFASSA